VLASAEVMVSVDLLGLTEERIASVGITGVGVAVVATSRSVDKVAAETDEFEIFVVEIEANRVDLKATFDTVLFCSFVAFIVAMSGYFYAAVCGNDCECDRG